jgi:hypothetical protein
MANAGRYILIFIAVLALASFCVSAQDDEHYTHYNEDFTEGTTLTIELEVLDKVVFTYYDENYTFSVMGISEEASTVRVEKRAFETAIGGNLFFDFDDETDEDISVTLLSVDDETGMYRLELFKKVWDVPEVNDTEEDEDNETEEDEDEEPEEPEEDEEEEDEEPEEEEEEPEEDEEEEPEEEKEEKNSPTGGTTVNITINFTLGEGGLMGLLIVLIVVAVGLIAYKKIRKRKFSEYEVVSTRKKRKKKRPTK